MSNEPVLSQEDLEVAAYFRRTGSRQVDLWLQAFQLGLRVGESEGRKEERERITVALDVLRNGYYHRWRLSRHPYAGGAMDALDLALHDINAEGNSDE